MSLSPRQTERALLLTRYPSGFPSRLALLCTLSGHAVSQAAFQQFAAETNTALLRLSESVRELRQGIVLGDLRTERAEAASSEDRRTPWTKSTVLSYSHSKKEEQLSYLHETSSALDQVTQAAVLEDIKPLHAGLPPSLERDLTQSLEGFALSSILNEHDTVSPAYLKSPLPWLRSKTPWHAATGLRSLLASQYHAENLLRGHFSTLRLTMYIVHQPALLRESAAFWALLDDQLHLVDPAWLALYASLLAVPAAHRPGYAGVSQALAEIALACLDVSSVYRAVHERLNLISPQPRLCSFVDVRLALNTADPDRSDIHVSS